MKLVFFETPLFSRYRPQYLDDDTYCMMQNALLENPECGDVMPGTGGFRKMRWSDTRRGKGKRGGLRVIYYFLKNSAQIWLFTLYAKNETEDLSAAEKELLKQAIAKELAARQEDTP